MSTKTKPTSIVLTVERTAQRANLARTVLTVAWLSIALGLLLEIILLLIAVVSGSFAGSHPFIADAVQKVAWSAFICVGLAFGQAASRLRPQLTGILGSLAAPLGFQVSRILHKAAESALGLAGTVTAGPSLLFIAVLRALEYGALGTTLGYLAEKRTESPLPYLAAGFAIGCLFGGVSLAATLQYTSQPLSAAAIATRAVNEILFPLGCSLVIYASEALSKQVPSPA